MVDLVNLQSEPTNDGTDPTNGSDEDSVEEILLKRRYSFPLEGLVEDFYDPHFED